MSGLTLSTELVKNPHVTQILVDEEMILMAETTQTYFSCNAIGAELWSLFNLSRVTLTDVAQYLQKAYHLEAQRSIQDAQAFVGLLLANDLVSIAPV